jgi:hypothetical protein
MSTSFPSSTISSTATSRKSASLPSWLHEPLLHFVILGAVLFGIDHAMVGRTDDPRTIVVGEEVDTEAKQIFTASRGRDPNEEELMALRRVWLDNEVLYREGLALQVDRGDAAIRERVIFKALSVVDANVKLPPIDDATLRAWFESHRVKYDEPARFDFEEAVLSGENSEHEVRAFVRALNNGTPGDAKAGLRVFKGRPHANLVQTYGEDFAQALQKSKMGDWQALQTRDGWRAVRLDSIAAARPAVYEVQRGVVLQDWKDAIASEQRTAAVGVLAKKYKVRFENETKAK